MRELLRSVWAEPRSPDPPARAIRDWVLVVLVVALVVTEGLVKQSYFFAAVAVVLAPTLLWRRSRPLLMVAIAFTGNALASLVVGHEHDLITMAYGLLLPYALFRWGSGREAVAGAGIILGKICLSASAGYLGLGDTLAGFVVMFAIFALALALRYRARLRARELGQAKLLERERLARDLHDTVAHHVSAMAIRAQAGIAVARTRPAAAVEALHVIEAEASRALAEMRAVVHDLRRQDDDDLRTSIERLAAGEQTGPVVDVELAGDLDDIPPTVGTAIYRLAQESVTNARRHARHATRIEVRVAADAGSVRLRVSDDGEAVPAGDGGFGLAGMAERAGLLGGTVDAGPGPERGWTVTAALPRR